MEIVISKKRKVLPVKYLGELINGNKSLIVKNFRGGLKLDDILDYLEEKDYEYIIKKYAEIYDRESREIKTPMLKNTLLYNSYEYCDLHMIDTDLAEEIYEKNKSKLKIELIKMKESKENEQI